MFKTISRGNVFYSFLIIIILVLYTGVYSQTDDILSTPKDFKTDQTLYFIQYSPDGKFLINTCTKHQIVIRDANTGKVYRTLTDIQKRINAIVATQAAQTVYIAGDEGIIYKWHPEKQALSSSGNKRGNPIYALAISPDYRFLISGNKQGVIQVWNADDLSQITELKRHNKTISSIDISPDGESFVAGSADGSISEWSLEDYRLLHVSNTSENWIRCVAYSPDGQTIASGGDDKLITLWDRRQLKPINSLSGHSDWVQCIDFSPGGNYLVSGGHDQQIILWNLSEGKIMQSSQKEGHIVMSIGFSPDGTKLLSSYLFAEKYQIRSLPPLADQDAMEYFSKQVTQNQLLEDIDLRIDNQPEKTIETKTDKESVDPTVESTGQSVPIPIDEKPASQPEITIFSPEFNMGRVSTAQSEITILGKITDPTGISAALINKEPVELSQAGIFTYTIKLKTGLNDLSLFAVNNEGILSKKELNIECTAETPAEKEVVPQVYSGKYYALIIAINEYDDPEILDLDMPLKDAQSLYNTLVKRYTFEPERINFLKNPSRAEIIVALDELSRIVTEEDNLLIFYAGHGHWDEQGKIGYWLPRDAMKSNTANWVRNSTMRDFIGSIKSKHTILIADACFSGSIFKSRAAFSQPPGGISKLHSLPSRKAMTSGTLELVPDESVFLKFLIKRLEKNNEKFLPSESLYSELKPAVLNNSPNIPQFGTIQNVGDEGGDFIFILK